MASSSSICSFTGITALGGAIVGKGLANKGGSIAQAVGGAAGIAGAGNALGSIAGAASKFSSIPALSSAIPGGALSKLTSNVNISSFGSSVLGGSLSNAVGGAFSSLPSGLTALGGGTFSSALGSHAGDLFGGSPIKAFQAFNGAEAFSNISQSLAGPIKSALGAEFGQAVSSLTQVLPSGGDFGNFLGASIPDLQGAITNGMSGLTSVIGDMPNFSSELANLGTAFNLGNLSEFGNPGQLVQQISAAGGLGITGLDSALREVGLGDVNIASLSNGMYNEALTDALGFVENPVMLANAQKLLGSNVAGLGNLADYTDMAKMMPASFGSIPFDNFSQFSEHLQGVELGSLSTPGQLGGLLTSLHTVDIPTIINTQNVIDPSALVNLTSNFLGGTGSGGAILTSDLIGSVGGINLTAPYAGWTNAITTISDGGGFDAVNTLYNQMSSGIAGDYLDVIGDAVASVTITDPATSIAYEELDKFVLAKAGQIESAIAQIPNAWATESAVAQANWTPMEKQVYDEKLHAGKTDLQLSLRTDSPENAYHFVTGHVERAAKSDVIAIVDGMVNQAVDAGDKFGEYWRAYNAESKNKNLVEPYNIRWRNEHQEEIGFA